MLLFFSFARDKIMFEVPFLKYINFKENINNARFQQLQRFRTEKSQIDLTRRGFLRETDFSGHWRVDFWYLKMKPSAHISVKWALFLEIWAI